MFGRKDDANLWMFDTIAQTEALNRLLYVVENGDSFCLLDGAYGTGKTTVLQRTAENLAQNGRRAVLQNLSSLDSRAALWHLCGALSIFSQTDADTSQLMMLVRDELTARSECQHQTVLLLDDADLAQPDIEIVLHLLTTIADASHGHLAVLLSAEKPLPLERLQRNTLCVTLEPLEQNEAVEFAVRYLAHLGGAVDNISHSGWRAIADLGDGLPGQLMQVCRIVQTVASIQPGAVDAGLIREAAQQLLRAA